MTIEAGQEPRRMPRTYSASEFNIDDFLKDSVTLPVDTVTVYTDASAAWEYNELVKRHDEIQSRKVEAGDDAKSIISGLLSTEDYAELNAVQHQMDAALEELKDSAIIFTMRAMYPYEHRNAIEKAKRLTNEHFKGQATPSDDERAEYESDTFVVEAFVIEIMKMRLANGDEINGPLAANQVRKLMDTLNLHEWGKLISKHTELNTRSVIRDAQVDAGFPG